MIELTTIADFILMFCGLAFTYFLIPWIKGLYRINGAKAEPLDIEARKAAVKTAVLLLFVGGSIYILGGTIGAIGNLFTSLAWFSIAASPKSK